STDTQTACGSYTWIDGNTYTSSNNTANIIYAGATANGCDSIVTLNLLINQPTTGVDIQHACEAFTWIDGNTYTADNNTATFPLVGVNGCDSVVTLNLTIAAAIDNVITATGTTLVAQANNLGYQWLDCDNNYSPIPGATNQSYTATVNGNYAVALSNNACADTSACMPITQVATTKIEELN